MRVKGPVRDRLGEWIERTPHARAIGPLPCESGPAAAADKARIRKECGSFFLPVLLAQEAAQVPVLSAGGFQIEDQVLDR